MEFFRAVDYTLGRKAKSVLRPFRKVKVSALDKSTVEALIDAVAEAQASGAWSAKAVARDVSAETGERVSPYQANVVWTMLARKVEYTS